MAPTPLLRAIALAVLASGAAGCGARTSLPGDAKGEGGSAIAGTTSSGPACTTDGDCDDRVRCTIDTCYAGACGHEPHSELCDDGHLCTIDTCDPAVGCESAPSNAACDDAIACTLDSCDVATDQCLHDACDSVCDDGRFCDGVERCDTTFGCTRGAPSCELGLGCDRSSCSEADFTCGHALPAGCVPPGLHLLITDSNGGLHEVAPYTDEDTLIAASSGAAHLDIAILDGRWFAIDGNIVELDPGTNDVLQDLGFGASGSNSLAGGPDGKLYAAETAVYRIDPDTGSTEILGNLPPGHSSSGDIAFLGERMFVSTDSGCGGALVEFDPKTGAATVLGGDGLGCVFGLAPLGSQLLVVNCDGKIGTFDPETGQTQVIATTQVSAYGADILDW